MEASLVLLIKAYAVAEFFNDLGRGLGPDGLATAVRDVRLAGSDHLVGDLQKDPAQIRIYLVNLNCALFI